MAIVFASGFEHADTSDGGIWSGNNGTYYASAAYTGNYGYRCYDASGTQRRVYKQIAANGHTGDWGVHWRMKVVTQPGSNPQELFNLYDTGASYNVVQLVYANVASSHYLRLRDGVSGTIGSDVALTLDTWLRCELLYTYSTRAVTLYINGTATSASGNAHSSYDNASQVLFGWSASATGDVYYDDVVILDSSAALPSANTNGGLKVSRLWVDGDGTLDTGEAAGTRGGTDSGAVWSQLEENPPNDATDYAILDASGEACPTTLYSASTVIASGEDIKAVCVSSRGRRGSTGTRYFRRKIRGSSGTWADIDGADKPISSNTYYTNGSSGLQLQAISATNPDGGAAWTRTALDSAEISTRCMGAYPIWITAQWADVVHYTPSATHYTLTCDAASYAISVLAATLARSRVFAADAASYTIAGQAATLSLGFSMVADAASYAVSVADTAWKRTYAVAADAGAYATSVAAATLARGLKLTADAASYAVSVQAATFQRGFSMAADAASYVATVAAATSRRTYAVAGEAASYVLSVGAATLARGIKFAADAGAYTVSVPAATLAYGRKLTAATGSFLVAGQDAIVTVGRKLLALVGAYTVTVEDATLTHTQPGILQADPASYAITFPDAELVYSGEAVARRPFWVPSGRPSIRALASNVFRGRPGRAPALGRGGRR